MSRPSGKPQVNGSSTEKSYFEQQRALLVRNIGVGLEQVLQNVNKLNRSLEGIIAVGNEFSSVEALWSHFETVMAKDEDADETQNSAESVEQASAGQDSARRS